MICRGLDGGNFSCTFREALFLGLSPSGSLLLPASLPRFSEDELAALFALRSPSERMGRIAECLLADEFGGDGVREIVEAALDFPIPLVELSGETFLLELFHGPSLAFKDVGARFMARAMSRCRPEGYGGERVTILTATSGDTGSAVVSAFHRVPGIEVVVLYPKGRVSELQELQMVTSGDNVRAIAVRGTFDDCQRLVKAAFADAFLREVAGLTTANSMNLGRLLPQMFYYFEASALLFERRRKPPVVVSVPSGNFGNLTAGLLARSMGLPVPRFLAATNRNDVVPRYLESGAFLPRATVETYSNAMDVSDPNNWPRVEKVLGVSEEDLRKTVAGAAVSDPETLEVIRAVENLEDYVLDPHGAVGYAALRRSFPDRSAPAVILATAHPGKFPGVVSEALGREIPIPKVLTDLRKRPTFKSELDPEVAALRDVLLER